MMVITVFGAGSIGSLFAGKIAHSGYSTSVIGRDPHILEINRHGLRIIEEYEEILTHLPADTVFPSEIISSEVLFITTKAYSNPIVASSMYKKIRSDIPIFVLQNGMGNEEVFISRFSQNPIFRAITTEAAEVVHPGIVNHVAFGKTVFGQVQGSENGFSDRIQKIITKSGFEIQSTPDIQIKMWQKLLTNAAICPLAAILQVPNGKILEKSSIRNIFNAIIEEGLTVAQINLPEVDFSETRDFTLSVIEKTKKNKCSMLQDVERKRKTEIDFINGFIVRESRRLGLKAPINTAITDLMHHIEQYSLN